jgi:hypothetical protein
MKLVNNGVKVKLNKNSAFERVDIEGTGLKLEVHRL